jgi:desulfoferrodoxin (superoxide reductase-like protein)
MKGGGAMKPYRMIILIGAVVCLLAMVTTPALANKTSLRIEAPTEVSPGSTITITLHVMHNGNNLFHYTNWVRVSINGTELQRWEFSRGNRPESENFTLTKTYTVSEPLEIVAEANCNLHGSAGPAFATVKLK